MAVAGWFGAGHLGDELILSSLSKSLQGLLAVPVAITTNTDNTWLTHHIDSVQHRSPRDNRRLAEAMVRIKGLVMSGGLIQNETSMWNLPFHTQRLRAAAGLPWAAVGLGVGRVKGPLGRFLASRYMRKVNPVAVRDRDSATRLADLGVKNVQVGADPAMAIEADPVPAGNTICVILRTPNRPGWTTAARKTAPISIPEAQAIAGALDSTARSTGFTLRMVSFNSRRDHAVHKTVAEHLTTPRELVTPRLDSVLAEVGQSRLVITMRYHGAIAALLNLRPAVLLDYSPKMRSMAAEGGGWAPLVDYRNWQPNQLRSATEQAMGAETRIVGVREEVKSRLKVNERALEELVTCAM